jgi:anti-anti-sigma regulatory factor
MALIEGVGVTIWVDDAGPAGTCVVVRGEVDASNVGALGAALDLACSDFPARVIVDLTQATLLATCAVRTLRDVSRIISGFAEFGVQGASPFIRRVMTLTGDEMLLAPATTSIDLTEIPAPTEQSIG